MKALKENAVLIVGGLAACAFIAFGGWSMSLIIRALLKYLAS